MQSLLVFTTPPGECVYLPERQWSLEYELVSELSGPEYPPPHDRRLAALRPHDVPSRMPGVPGLHAAARPRRRLPPRPQPEALPAGQRGRRRTGDRRAVGDARKSSACTTPSTRSRRTTRVGPRRGNPTPRATPSPTSSSRSPSRSGATTSTAGSSASATWTRSPRRCRGTRGQEGCRRFTSSTTPPSAAGRWGRGTSSRPSKKPPGAAFPTSTSATTSPGAPRWSTRLTSAPNEMRPAGGKWVHETPAPEADDHE